ncbi:hypothetical protein [Paraburkholderia graminis]|uniref:hypothetical protein n=1 Tax=Paraburkholderia graminis TaxID=60548 RepID=UPI0038B8C293
MLYSERQCDRQRDRHRVRAVACRCGHAELVGRSQYSGDPYFHGSIDEFRIYHGAMPAD